MSTAPGVTRIVVVQCDGAWQMVCAGHDAGRFDFSVDAIDAAIRTAKSRMAKGERVEMQVQDKSGHVRNVNPVDGGELH